MRAKASASRPHRRVAMPLPHSSAASAVPHEPAPRTATVARDMASGVQGGLGVALADLTLLLTLLFGIQGVEVDRLQQQRREPAVQDQIGYDLTREREQYVRAIRGQHHRQVLLIEAREREHAGLVHFREVRGALVQGAGDREGQHHFVAVDFQRTRLSGHSATRRGIDAANSGASRGYCRAELPRATRITMRRMPWHAYA